MDQEVDRLIEKVDKLYDLAVSVKETTAVHEQKWREINHSMQNGRQANMLAQTMLKNKLDRIENLMESKVNINDYKAAFNDMKEALHKDRKMWMIIVMVSLTANGVASNIDFFKQLISTFIGIR